MISLSYCIKAYLFVYKNCIPKFLLLEILDGISVVVPRAFEISCIACKISTYLLKLGWVRFNSTETNLDSARAESDYTYPTRPRDFFSSPPFPAFSFQNPLSWLSNLGFEGHLSLDLKFELRFSVLVWV